MTPVLVAVFSIAFIILFLALKSKGTGAPAPPVTTGRPEAFEPFQGEHDGISYTAESLEPTTVTVSIEIRGGLSRALEVNARRSRPAMKADGREGEIEALLRLGADYIDIGFNTNRVAAEFPVNTVKMARPLAERAASHLKRLGEMSA